MYICVFVQHVDLFLDHDLDILLESSFIQMLQNSYSAIWDPYYSIHNGLLKFVEKLFYIYINIPSYANRLGLVKLHTVNIYRTTYVSFMFNLVNGNVFCNFLLRSFKPNVPYRNFRYYNLTYDKLCY